MMEYELEGVMSRTPEKAVCACCGRSYSVKQLHKRVVYSEARDGMMFVHWRCKRGTHNFTAYPIAKVMKM